MKPAKTRSALNSGDYETKAKRHNKSDPRTMPWLQANGKKKEGKCLFDELCFSGRPLFRKISPKSAIKMQVVTIICYALASLLHILEKKGNRY